MPFLFAFLLFPTHARSQPPAVSTAPAAAVAAPAAPAAALRLLAPSEYPDFSDSFKSKAGLIKAARKTLAYLEGPDYAGPRYFHLGERTYGQGILVDSVQELLASIKEAKTPGQFAALIRQRFDVYQSAGSDGNGKVVFSSYYQPILTASKQRSARYRYPIYRRPPDMVEVNLSAFDPKAASRTYVGRVDKRHRLVPYFSRSDIDVKRALAGKRLELAWLKDKFDVLDLHIQGSGILRFPSGHQVLAKYAATNDLPYNSIGILLVKAGAFARDQITHDRVRQYLHDHPEAEDWLLAQDPRYTFFDLAPLPKDGEPDGSIKQSLVPARSIAIDPALAPLGSIAYFTTTSPQADSKGRLLGQFPNSRFALCMDTGGAIKGPGRVDIYAGHGPQAETTARNQWAAGKLYFLIAKIPPRER